MHRREQRGSCSRAWKLSGPPVSCGRRRAWPCRIPLAHIPSRWRGKGQWIHPKARAAHCSSAFRFLDILQCKTPYYGCNHSFNSK